MNQITAEGSRHKLIHLSNNNLSTVGHWLRIIAGRSEGTEAMLIRKTYHDKRHIHRQFCTEKLGNFMEKTRTVVGIALSYRLTRSGAKKKTVKNKMAFHLRSRVLTFSQRNKMTNFYIFIHLVIFHQCINQIGRLTGRMSRHHSISAFNITNRFLRGYHLRIINIFPILNIHTLYPPYYLLLYFTPKSNTRKNFGDSTMFKKNTAKQLNCLTVVFLSSVGFCPQCGQIVQRLI